MNVDIKERLCSHIHIDMFYFLLFMEDPDMYRRTPRRKCSVKLCPLPDSLPPSPQLTVAREQAVLGEYATATVYYDGVLAQIRRHVR
jgi:hypothetical protein